jgi:hypothetical protein
MANQSFLPNAGLQVCSMVSIAIRSMYEPGFFASNQKTSLLICLLGSTTSIRYVLVPVPFLVVKEQSRRNFVPRLPVVGEMPKLENLASPWSLTTNTRF